VESFSSTFKALILRHRSVAVLIRRGHLDDARLLLARFAADVDAFESLPGSLRNHSLFASKASILEAEIGPGELDPQTVRSLKDLNAICLKAVLAMADAKKSSETRRSALLLAMAAVLLAGITWGTYHFIGSAKLEKTAENLQFMSKIMTIAKHNTGKTLIELTNNACSECPCRDGQDLRGKQQGDVCQANWIRALGSCWEGASGESPYDIYGGIILEKRFLRDPWNSPYALDENAGKLRSAGPDGILDTSDDISVTVQTLTR